MKVMHVGRGQQYVEVERVNYLADAIAPALAKYKSQVQDATWGHTRVKPGKKYKGFILFTYTAWQHCVPIEAAFTGLTCSPWFFDDLLDFVNAQCTEDRLGQVLKFNGTYLKNEDDSCVFSGSVEQVKIGGQA